MRLKEELGEVMRESGARTRIKTRTEAKDINGRKSYGVARQSTQPL